MESRRRFALGQGFAAVVFALSALTFFAELPLAFERLTIAGTHGEHPGLTPASAAELRDAGLTPEFFAAYFTAIFLVFYAAYTGVGWALLLRKPNEPMAALLAVWMFAFGAGFPTGFGTLSSQFPLWRPAAETLWLASTVSLYYAIQLFPNGRFDPHWSRWLPLAGIAIELANRAGAAFPFPGLREALGVLFAGWMLLFLYAQLVRYRMRLTSLEKQQTKWVLFFLACSLALLAALPIVGSYVTGIWMEFAGNTAIYLALTGVPVAIFVAMMRYRLWDIDPIIRRTLLYGSLSAVLLAIYMLTVTYFATLFRSGPNLFVSLLGTGAVTLAFQPVQVHLRRLVNRLMYGDADDPYTVLTRLSKRLENELAPAASLEVVVDTLREALKLPYAAVTLASDGPPRVVASSGERSADAVVMPLQVHGAVIGSLELGRRSAGEQFRPSDRVLLEQIALQAGALAQSIRLHDALRASRTHLVRAREAERRRLRRELHDAIAPVLAAQLLKIGTVRHAAGEAAPAIEPLLSQIERDIELAIAEIRRLVYGLRPPTLDEYGLLSAIQELARPYGLPPSRLRLELSLPDALPPLDAAVEVAAYRILQEALNNVGRHARASRARVRLELRGERLELEIADDGVGLSESHPDGVGLASMRERAEELGGAFFAEAGGASPGTRIRVSLPIAAAPAAGTREEVRDHDEEHNE